MTSVVNDIITRQSMTNDATQTTAKQKQQLLSFLTNYERHPKKTVESSRKYTWHTGGHVMCIERMKLRPQMTQKSIVPQYVSNTYTYMTLIHNILRMTLIHNIQQQRKTKWSNDHCFYFSMWMISLISLPVLTWSPHLKERPALPANGEKWSHLRVNHVRNDSPAN